VVKNCVQKNNFSFHFVFQSTPPPKKTTRGKTGLQFLDTEAIETTLTLSEEEEEQETEDEMEEVPGTQPQWDMLRKEREEEEKIEEVDLEPDNPQEEQQQE
jgi:hypothetical protein